MDNQYCRYDQPISLRDYIIPLLKRKKSALLIFLGCIIVATTINFLSPKIYEISMVIELGSIGISDKGETLYLDSERNIIEKIKENVYTQSVATSLGVSSYKINTDFKVTQPGTSHLIKIALEEKKEKIDEGIKILNQLFLALYESNKEVVESKKKEIENQINIISGLVTEKQKEMKRIDSTIAFLQDQEGVIKDKIREEISSSDSRKKNPVIQQLNGELFELQKEEDRKIGESRDLAERIVEFKLRIEALSNLRNNIYNIRLLREPSVSQFAVKPQKKRNMILAVLGSLAVSLFFVFFMEFWGSSIVLKE